MGLLGKKLAEILAWYLIAWATGEKDFSSAQVSRNLKQHMARMAVKFYINNYDNPHLYWGQPGGGYARMEAIEGNYERAVSAIKRQTYF